ncbi:conserved hypothetical protein [Amycolatopsis xylanica]|uniref:SnoaL-like domain-containing protein n=1 Tax=Amycolatopsis xylanica TaxID=589385 RepID=A0A1H2UQ84_9PSEU|nr:nuclear transport factor 2 family protein [Amycolatopsis xylanica]SDW58255.1 conserved hypothetical protein [Amycolatopsis xylanica]
MIQQATHRYGPDSANRLDAATAHGAEGARAALQTFYYALNSRDGAALAEVWADDPLVQLNNPVGGILRGRDAVAALYDKIFHGPIRVQVTFSDIVEYLDDSHAVFAGAETGSYTTPEGTAVPLRIRTSRYFRFTAAGWRQYHHHGSIDDPEALRAYQHAVRGGA